MTKRPDSSSLELVSKTCLKRVETDPEVFCEANAVFNGKECCLQVPVATIFKCPLQRFGSSDDNCFRLRRRTPQYVCLAGYEQVCRGSPRLSSPANCECVATTEEKPNPVCPEGAQYHDETCVLYEEPIAYCPEKGAELIDDAFCVKTVREPVRLRTTLALECIGKECFDKIRSQLARNNMLPALAGDTPTTFPVVDLDEADPLADVEILTTRQIKRQARRCAECSAHFEMTEDL
ncbi:MAG: hypothetical protein KVP17_000612 [Porospora cf. gigantea B]|uniref:uncharacterized protein n=1 Tax=Porospora cf. gigantea B TaxID=2853592 RepID=UPI003571B001|nr:MAG: hypothetical protein KVP17_000612 [Porospora cf. gigantea B]